MTIQTTINNGKIQIDLYDFVKAMSDEAKLELIENLSCEDLVIKHVMDQVLCRETENGYAGYTSTLNLPCTVLDKARRRVAMEHSDVVENEHRKLLRTSERVKELVELMGKFEETWLSCGWKGWDSWLKIYCKVKGLV